MKNLGKDQLIHILKATSGLNRYDEVLDGDRDDHVSALGFD